MSVSVLVSESEGAKRGGGWERGDVKKQGRRSDGEEERRSEGERIEKGKREIGFAALTSPW